MTWFMFINGNAFVLAINDMNHVFSGGNNSEGQLGRHPEELDTFHKVFDMISELNDKNITQICCGGEHSLALTTNGQVSFAITIEGWVFSWGENPYGELGYKPNGSNSLSPKLIPNLDDIKSISASFHEDNGFTHYQNLFEELSPIGSGRFGTVFKVKHRFDEHIYAVKRVQFESSSDHYMNEILNEVKNLGKVRSEYCVQYFNSWPESTYLYIQMEFCSQNLRNILEIKPKLFDRGLGEAMSSYEYFISCEIFRQILESVQYLHELNPQIIHSDLKPDNILIDGKGRNVHQKNNNMSTCDKYTTGVGTPKYQAPEIAQDLDNHFHKVSTSFWHNMSVHNINKMIVILVVSLLSALTVHSSDITIAHLAN
ncbi:unnamed protein product, partial [Oppiella nova]